MAKFQSFLAVNFFIRVELNNRAVGGRRRLHFVKKLELSSKSNSALQNTLYIRNEYYLEVPIDLDLFYNYEEEIMQEFHMEIYSDKLSFNTIDLWAYR